jgi:hypothetical protein
LLTSLLPSIYRDDKIIHRREGAEWRGGVVSGTRNNVVPQQEQTTTTKEAKESSCGHTLPTEGLLSANNTAAQAHRASVGNMTIHWAAGFGTAHRMLCSPRPISFPFPRTWGVKVEGIETSSFLSLFRVSVLVRPWSARVAYQYTHRGAFSANPRTLSTFASTHNLNFDTF